MTTMSLLFFYHQLVLSNYKQKKKKRKKTKTIRDNKIKLSFAINVRSGLVAKPYIRTVWSSLAYAVRPGQAQSTDR